MLTQHFQGLGMSGTNKVSRRGVPGTQSNEEPNRTTHDYSQFNREGKTFRKILAWTPEHFLNSSEFSRPFLIGTLYSILATDKSLKHVLIINAKT